jgi:hypothetical protein
MDSLLAMWFAALHAPFELFGNLLDGIESQGRHQAQDGRRRAQCDPVSRRAGEIERLERRLAELKG